MAQLHVQHPPGASAAGGVTELGRLPFVDDERLAALLAESRAAPKTTVAPGRRCAPPGPALRELTVDHRLAAAVSAAVGFAVAPTYRAVYRDDEPGALVHLDDGDVSVHLTLAHSPPDDGDPGAPLELVPGEALVLRGRETARAHEPLQAGERVERLSIGFARATMGA